MKKNSDNNMPIGKLTPIADDLPAPKELARSLQSVRITIVLNKPSVDFFKRQAEKHHTKYQRMMRQVLDQYAVRHST